MKDLRGIIKETFLTERTSFQNETCDEPISLSAIAGLEAFNKGEFFLAHEFLEEAWNEDQSTGRNLYRAILQIAVAYYQIERKNYRGAIKMFFRVRQWLDPIPDECRGVDIQTLRVNALKVYEALIQLGPDKIIFFDHSLFLPIKFNKS